MFSVKQSISEEVTNFLGMAKWFWIKGLKVDFEVIIFFINWRGEQAQSWWVIAGAWWNVAPAVYWDLQVHISWPRYSKVVGRHWTFSRILLDGEGFLQRRRAWWLNYSWQHTVHIMVWKCCDFWPALTLCLGFFF